MQQDGPGLYIVALKGEWEHIVFARYYNSENVLFMHAGPHPKGAGINYDDGKNYILNFSDWKHIWTVKLSGDIVIKWFMDTPIIPYIK